MRDFRETRHYFTETGSRLKCQCLGVDEARVINFRSSGRRPIDNTISMFAALGQAPSPPVCWGEHAGSHQSAESKWQQRSSRRPFAASAFLSPLPPLDNGLFGCFGRRGAYRTRPASDGRGDPSHRNGPIRRRSTKGCTLHTETARTANGCC